MVQTINSIDAGVGGGSAENNGGPDISGLLGVAGNVLAGIQGLDGIAGKINDAANAALGAIGMKQLDATTTIESKKMEALFAISTASPTSGNSAAERSARNPPPGVELTR